MRRYKYIGRDGSSGYRTGKYYWARKIESNYTSSVWFVPLNINRKEIGYTNIERFKANWE